MKIAKAKKKLSRADKKKKIQFPKLAPMGLRNGWWKIRSITGLKTNLHSLFFSTLKRKRGKESGERKKKKKSMRGERGLIVEKKERRGNSRGRRGEVVQAAERNQKEKMERKGKRKKSNIRNANPKKKKTKTHVEDEIY